MPSIAVIIGSIEDDLNAIQNQGGDLDLASRILPQGYKIVSIAEPDAISVPPTRRAQGRKKSIKSVFGWDLDENRLWNSLRVFNSDYIPAAIRSKSIKRTPITETQLWILGYLSKM